MPRRTPSTWTIGIQTHNPYVSTRVLASPEEAESGEEYFNETTNGVAKFVRPHAFVRQRLNTDKLDPLEMSMVDLREEFEEEEKENDPMEIDYTLPALSQPAVPSIGVQTRDDHSARLQVQ